jgi:uncharacterized membrane protein YphA (DoxX/SURF4 family)
MSNLPSKQRIAFATGFFLVLLRVAIGWHFFYEGVWKINSHAPGHTPFTAEHYLRASQGPLRDLFLMLIPDADGFDAMKEETMKAVVDKRYDQYARFYAFNDEQKPVLEKARDRAKEKATALVNDPSFKARVEDYKTFLKRVKDKACEKEGDFTVERRSADQGKLDIFRNQLLADTRQPVKDLETAANGMLTNEQRQKGPVPPMKGPTYLLDVAMTWSLTLIGAAMILGVLTRLSCLGAAGLLATFYFSMPPWPGLPDIAMSEGHYLIVNKNLVELIAVLMLATTCSGRWFGLDGLIHRFITGRCCSDRTDQNS